MIRQWYEPAGFFEWLRRTFCFLNIAVFMLTAMVVFSEFRFDWFENLVGSYLISTNEFRSETGAVWEKGKQTSNARKYINKMISQKEDARQSVHKASSFSGLASRLLPGEWVILEKQRFKALYLTLEKSTALKLIEPARLLWLLNGSSLDRIFCEGIKGGIKIYFIDSENRVIKQIDLKKQDILDIENGEKPVSGNLDQIDGFAGRIFSAENFFDALFKLPADIIPDLMENPQALLKQDGRITRVGIWNEVKNGYIELGFEFKGTQDSQVVFVKGREWAVWQLSLNLKREEN
ncbi:conserved uncharacterized protein [Desulfobacula toluolica Tol2]|uniref:Conserved uncharacterized protein n=1 Tax=Desulfobacula toluolica (strain DSM 7467 / Tol2) TaxID=651182 RepID=K0ND77_DESTT|nr:conserved uncharacterized protein [Desulfobacula toluolica Tol2]